MCVDVYLLACEGVVSWHCVNLTLEGVGGTRCMWLQGGSFRAMNSWGVRRWLRDSCKKVWWDDVEVVDRQVDDGGVMLLES